MAQESRRAVIAALLGNAALVVLKAVAAGFTGSAAMLAETYHSISDTGNQLLLLLGMRLARRPPGPRHPFGHGRNVYFWSFVVSMLLFTLGGAFSIREGIHFLWDALASGVIGATLIGVALFLAYENYSLLIGESTSPEIQAAIRRAIERDPSVARVVSIRTMHIAPEEIVVAAAVDFRDDQSVPDVEVAVPRLHAAIRRAAPEARFILVEPATTSPAPPQRVA
jgi:divalent metal cation (Fe/Co/Zn/Cd) transporter